MRADWARWRVVAVVFVVLCGLDAVSPDSGCPLRCVCRDDDRDVRCAHAGLDTIPQVLHVQLQKFIAPGNDISLLDQLYAYPMLETLDLSKNRLIRIDGKPFESQRNLVSLDLSSNRLLRLDKTAFTGLRSLLVLNLSRNSLAEVDVAVFAPLATLRTLVLTDNRIKTLPGLGAVLPRLASLDLSRNEVTDVVQLLNGGTWGLSELRLAGNRLSLAARDFENVPRLEKLDLSLCHFVAFHEAAFAGLKFLREFNVSGNKLAEVPTPVFLHMQGLKVLNLSANAFKAVLPSAFGNLTELKVLDISNSNNLEKIMPGALAGLDSLEKLDLSGCRSLYALGKDSLAFARRLKHVDLASSGLASLHVNLFGSPDSSDFAARLLTFNLSHCPLSCDCDLAWLRNPTKFRATGAVCHSPRRVQGVHVIDVTNDDAFQCQSGSFSLYIVLSLAAVGAVLGLAAVISFGLVMRRRREKKQRGSVEAPDILQNVPFLANYHPPTEQIFYDLRHDYPFATDTPSGVTGFKLEPVTDL